MGYKSPVDEGDDHEGPGVEDQLPPDEPPQRAPPTAAQQLSIFCKQRIINKVKLDQIQKPPTSETLEAGYYQCNTISQT